MVYITIKDILLARKAGPAPENAGSALRKGRIDELDIDMIVLAAGLSKRMGVFKPLLPVGDMPAVARCVKMAAEAGVRDVVIVTGHNAGTLEDVVGKDTHPGIRLVHNAAYQEGMFSSVREGVSALRDGSDAFFLLPADCCASTADTLSALMRVFGENGGVSVVRPAFCGKRGHPPLVPGRFAEPLLSYDGEGGLKGFLRPLPTTEVEMGDPGALLDMDTPEDYAALLEHLGVPCFPDRERCAKLLLKYDTPKDIVGHCESVAALALEFAREMAERGARLDAGLLESACLLHDIKRAEPNHARAGMELLLREGYPKAAILVGSHMELRGGVSDVIGEKELLFLADKMCRGEKIVALEEREREISGKYPHDSEAYASAMSRMATARKIRDMLKSGAVSFRF